MAGASHHLCLRVSGPSPHPKRMGARLSISGSLATGLCGLRTHQEGQPPSPDTRPHRDIHAAGTRQTSQRWREGQCVLPVGYTLLTLTTPLEGKATGQPASGWQVPRVFLQPVSLEDETVEGWGWVHVPPVC